MGLISKREKRYALLAMAGLELTWCHNLHFFAETGRLDLRDFITACFVNHASAWIAFDASIAAETHLTGLAWKRGDCR